MILNSSAILTVFCSKGNMTFYSNAITGMLVTELGLLLNLRHLDLGGNQLEGVIPTELRVLSQLRKSCLSGASNMHGENR